MIEEKGVLKKEHRDALFTKIREEPKFRDLLKKDWRAALKEMKIDPETVVKGKLTREEISTLAQQSGWEIIIIIFEASLGLERIRTSEAMNFEAR